MLWILPPRTPIVSTTGTPHAAMLLPSHTPPDGCQAIACPRSAPACLTRLNSASASGVSGLGGRPKPPLSSIATSRSAVDRGDRLVDLALRRRLDLGRSRAHVDAQDGKVGDDVARAAALDPRRIHAQAVALQPVEPKREIGRGEQRVAPVLGIAPRVRRAAANDDREIAASRPRAGERPVGQRRGLVGQRRALALRRLREQRRRCRAIPLPRRC